MLSSHFATSKMLHYRQLFSTNFPLPSELSQKTWEIFQISLDFFQKTSEFFTPPWRKEANGQETMDKQAIYIRLVQSTNKRAAFC